MGSVKMRNDTIVRARIDRNAKAQATETLHTMGLSVSDALRLLVLRVTAEKRLPFLVPVRNAVPVEAMQAWGEGKGAPLAHAEERFQELGVPEPIFDPAGDASRKTRVMDLEVPTVTWMKMDQEHHDLAGAR